MGTVSYMSPEQARGVVVDARTDVWSLGVVLYEMFTGRQPFIGETMTDVLASILRSEVTPLQDFVAGLPTELDPIVQKALGKDREERYQSVQDLLVDLRQLQKRLDFETELERNARSKKRATTDEAYKKATQVFDSAKQKSDERKRSEDGTQNKDAGQTLPPTNLSLARTKLIGREKEIAEVAKLLERDDVRLLTMTGVGGTGKTTLAQAVAGAMLTSFADGIFLIELAAITDAELVAPSIARSLGVKEMGGKPILEILGDYLREREMLLVVDNFEHVALAAPLLTELLRASPRLKILVTSRTLLHLSMEREYAVPPLAVPSDKHSIDELIEYAAVALFIERARAAKPNFTLTDENANSVMEICARLDGLPLAIELAAARVKILSPPQILAKLENRLQLLTGGARDLPARQQTMRGAVEWSYDLLTEDEKRLFRRLAVFAGGFTLEAAEAVYADCGLQNADCEMEEDKSAVRHPHSAIDVLDLITSLVDKNLLVSKERADGDVRFRMLEVVGEYALDALEGSNEAEAMRRSHAAYFLALGEEAEPHLQASQSAEWFNRLEEEHDNLRAALWWSLERDAEAAARLAAAIRILWIYHSHLTEGRVWLKAALERSSLDAPSAVRFKLLYALGQLAQNQGDYKAARKAFEEALAAGRAAGDKRHIAVSSRALGGVAKGQGDFTAARKFIEEALAISRELNDNFVMGTVLNSLGDLALIEGETAAARPLFEESLAIVRQLGNKHGVSVNLICLGAVAYGEGDDKAARSHYTEALAAAQELGQKILISYSLDGFAALAVKRGDAEPAARLAGAAEHLRKSIGFEIDTSDRRFRDAYLAELRAALDEADFADAYEQGHKLKLEEAIVLALAE